MPASDHRRLLANGHCTRPALLDCAFESVCERCGFFETGPQFLTILKRQRKHADERGQSDRSRALRAASSRESPTPSECASMGQNPGPKDHLYNAGTAAMLSQAAGLAKDGRLEAGAEAAAAARPTARGSLPRHLDHPYSDCSYS